jgi:gallate dioxygenase
LRHPVAKANEDLKIGRTQQQLRLLLRPTQSSGKTLDAPAPFKLNWRMARIVGSIAASHTPTIGFAYDQKKQADPAWAPIFDAFAPVQQWLLDQRPDVIFYIFNDHGTSFFFDHYSVFALGVGNSYAPADEGGGPRALPPLLGHPKLAAHIGNALVAEEFDLSFFQEPAWPAPIVPLQIGVIQFPIPTAKRCFKLGAALRRAIESYPDDLRVVIVSTGGLSHQVHGERAGFNNTSWDQRFLDLLEKDPATLAEMTHAQLATLGGFEGAEVIMHLVMRGAMSANVRKIHQGYYLPSMTGIGVAVYENEALDPMVDVYAAYRAQIAHQLDGVEKLAGTYPFDLERSVAAYRVNKFLHDLIVPANRAAFLEDPETAFAKAALTDEEQRMIRERAWRDMIHYGVSFFMLEKLGAVTGVSNLHIYAAMRGETLEDFQKSRNARILYSTSGTAT